MLVFRFFSWLVDWIIWIWYRDGFPIGWCWLMYPNSHLGYGYSPMWSVDGSSDIMKQLTFWSSKAQGLQWPTSSRNMARKQHRIPMAPRKSTQLSEARKNTPHTLGILIISVKHWLSNFNSPRSSLAYRDFHHENIPPFCWNHHEAPGQNCHQARNGPPSPRRRGGSLWRAPG